MLLMEKNMSKSKLVIVHDLSKLDAAQIQQYLRDVSEFIGLDPDLNALDTIWMQNENGPGQSLVVYARRGTAEILRNKLNIVVESLSQTVVNGSIIFTATGQNEMERQEIAVGSKYITGLTGKALDDAIMTASTRALRRLTMQFTTLGLLDESEVKSTVGDTVNPAAGAALAGSPMVIPPMPKITNNAPGKDVTVPTEKQAAFNAIPQTDAESTLAAAYKAHTTEFAAKQQAMRDEATRQLHKKHNDSVNDPAHLTSAKRSAEKDVTKQVMAEAEAGLPVSADVETPHILVGEAKDLAALAKPKRARKSKNTVSLEGPEPETVSALIPPQNVKEVFLPAATATEFPTGFPVHEVPAHVSVALPTAAQAVLSDPKATPAQQAAALATAIVAPDPQHAPVQTTADLKLQVFLGQPSLEQMGDYRKRVSVYTSQLPSSENLGSVQKMRAFITKMSGTAPQFMTVDQWEETLGWFEEFVNRNQIKGLVAYINDNLGVK
jgi:hypothetical protein